MKKYLLLTLSVFLVNTVCAQVKPSVGNFCVDKYGGKSFYDHETMPQFPGGPTGLIKYLSERLVYPKLAEKNGIQGRVITSFVVNKDGSITDVKVVKSVDSLLDKEAVRVVSLMPKWIPGTLNGKAVRVKYHIPVTFRLHDKK